MIKLENFTLLTPREILAVKGYALENYSIQMTIRSSQNVTLNEQDPNLHGIEVPALDMMKKIMRSAVETEYAIHLLPRHCKCCKP